MNSQTNLFEPMQHLPEALPPKNAMYEALLNRDAEFEGIFIVGVKTTGIFCRPTCPARKPKMENVEFFRSTKHALDSGYRPCKRCKPLQPKDNTPQWVEQILKEVEKDSNHKWNDSIIRESGVNPNRLRRWFKKHHGTTFHGYLRLRRLGNALGQIKHGEKTAQAAFDNGYESLSGFRGAMKNLLGKPVNRGKDTTQVYINRITTPLGPMLAGATDNALCLLEFIDRRMLETQLQTLQKKMNVTFIPGSNTVTDQTAEQINSYFNGSLKQFTVPLNFSGTDFQQKVWHELQTIPYSETRSYKEQAQHIGNAKAVRAVARANGENRIAIIIPCHRVIGSDGSLTGYGGGLWRKKYLLSLERENNENKNEN